ncbi:MAG: calcium/sodium antiporter [Thioalkalivibrio sp.]|nr:calcium/sodium antiporter [Thioalkalivibrio sp.]
MTALLIIAGLAFLMLGGELLVRGASKLAGSLGISPLAVGLTVVAFGTSAPELAVSIQATLAGHTDIALGNVVGSNIFNVLVILGLTAVITPLVVAGQMIRQEVPIMVGASVLLYVLAYDGTLSQIEAAAFAALAVAYTTLLIIQSRREIAAIREEYEGEGHIAATGWVDLGIVQFGLVVVGLLLLVLGSRWLVEGVTAIAVTLGISQLIIGLTIVAAGTSLPEVAASIAAAVKGQRDIAVGNAVGSNIFNILCVLGISGALSPGGLSVNQALIDFDMLVMIAVAFACLPVFFTDYTIARWEGTVFLAYYAAYTAYLVLDSQQHEAGPLFEVVMLGFVLPLTVLTLGIVVARSWRPRHERA